MLAVFLSKREITALSTGCMARGRDKKALAVITLIAISDGRLKGARFVLVYGTLP